jgi:hypothetical protein
MKTIAIILILSGIMLRYLIKKRKFKRTTYTGVEVFKSYEAAWFTKLIENLVFCMGTLMMIGGIITLIIKW